MMKKNFAFLCTFVILCGAGSLITLIAPGISSAAITVDLDATVYNQDNKFSQPLTAGIWDAELIKATFTAYSFWRDGRGWLHGYRITYDGTTKFVGDGIGYATADLAFAAAGPFQFSIPSDQNVLFWIKDGDSSDNLGGLSIQLTKVPIPGAVWLLGTGLICLVGVKRKFKN